LFADGGETKIDVFESEACHSLLLFFELFVNVLDVMVQNWIRTYLLDLMVHFF
jgi:hypothetical protein